MGICINVLGPPWGICNIFVKKRQMLVGGWGGGEGCARLELVTEPLRGAIMQIFIVAGCVIKIQIS